MLTTHDVMENNYGYFCNGRASNYPREASGSRHQGSLVKELSNSLKRFLLPPPQPPFVASEQYGTERFKKCLQLKSYYAKK